MSKKQQSNNQNFKIKKKLILITIESNRSWCKTIIFTMISANFVILIVIFIILLYTIFISWSIMTKIEL